MIALFTVGTQAAYAGATVPKVLVSIAPLKPAVDAVLSGITHSDVLARPGQDAHSMVLSPSQAKALASAEIIILPSRDMSNIVTELAKRYEKKGTVIIALDALKGAKPLPYETHQPWLHAHEEDDGDDEQVDSNEAEQSELNDPHVWLDPLRMAAIATPLAEAIAAHAPSLRGQMLANAQAWSTHVREELHPQIQNMLAAPAAKKRYNSRPYIPFVTSHSAFQYFLKRYNIDNPGALMLLPEDVLGARSNHTLLAQANKVTIGCVIAEQETAMVKRVATASGARIVILNPELLPAHDVGAGIDGLRDGYDRLLYETAETFQRCLEK